MALAAAWANHRHPGRTVTVALVMVLVGGLGPSRAEAVSQQGGSLDKSFGQGGTVVTPVTPGGSSASDVAVQRDGRILVVGRAWSNGGAFALARYRANGGLDATFGVGGTVLTDFDAAGSDDVAIALAIQADGKVVVLGRSDADGSEDFALVRYGVDGTLDTTFGLGGKLLTDCSSSGASDYPAGLAIQADGKIVAVGGSSGGFALVRYDADGSLDASFGTGGIVITTGFAGTGTSAGASDVAIQADGKIVAAGGSSTLGVFTQDFALARYDAHGNLDPSFGSGGEVLTDLTGGADAASALLIQSDGKILVAGSAPARLGSNFAVARYDADGSLDSSFGADGKAFANFGGTDYLLGSGLAMQEDGKIITAGLSNANGTNDFALARFTADGPLDASFGTGGLVLTDFDPQPSGDEAYGIALQHNGRIIAVGLSSAAGLPQFALARYRP